MHDLIRVLIVDDDPMVTSSLEILLSSEECIEVAGTASNGRQALEQVRLKQIDIVLMDIQMPIMDGISALRAIKKECPGVKIIMLTTFRDYRNIQKSLQAGASGFLLKSDDTNKQLQAIKAVYEGLPVISEEALRQFSQTDGLLSLTTRENEILVNLANGYSNKEIAERLFISEGTVRNNVSVILDKLQLRDRTQLAIYYWQNADAPARLE
jgi:DNA-binding NarL/FixJ family response regulator